jgi:hypothetical protein
MRPRRARCCRSRWRAAELARYALTQNRPVLTDAMVTDILNLKFEDPMFGLLGAHLILRDQSRDRPEDAARFADRFRIVTDNLLRLLGPDHPDLRALWLRRTDRGPANLVSAQLRSPPMLRASWDVAVKESFRDSDVIGTACSSISDKILPTVSWLIWRADAAKDRVDAMLSALGDYLKARTQAETVTEAIHSILAGTSTRNIPGPEALAAQALTPNEREDFARSFGIPGHVLDMMLQRLPR